MTEKSVKQRWTVNVAAFILLSVLTLTGVTNWLLLPRGYETARGGLVFLRHALRTVHEWTALLFVFVVLIHLALHWAYIRSNLRKSGILRSDRR
jgi:hypothetical protein